MLWFCGSHIALLSLVVVLSLVQLGRNPHHRSGPHASSLHGPSFSDDKPRAQYIADLVALFRLVERRVVPHGAVVVNLSYGARDPSMPKETVVELQRRTACRFIRLRGRMFGCCGWVSMLLVRRRVKHPGDLVVTSKFICFLFARTRSLPLTHFSSVPAPPHHPPLTRNSTACRCAPCASPRVGPPSPGRSSGPYAPGARTSRAPRP